MENVDKGLTVPKWMLIVCLKIPKMAQNLSAQFVCPRPKVLDFNEKRLHWAYVRGPWSRGQTMDAQFRLYPTKPKYYGLKSAACNLKNWSIGETLPEHIL